MRLFIAINCPELVKDALLEKQKQLGSFGDVKPVERDNLHMTLKFLGEVDEGRTEEIKKRLAVVMCPAYSLSLKGLGAFPSAANARVLWAGAEKGCGETMELAKKIEASLSGLGFEPERRFSCHLTLARARSVYDGHGLADYLRKEKETEFGSFLVDRFFLMESLLSRSGPRYSVVQGFTLGAR